MPFSRSVVDPVAALFVGTLLVVAEHVGGVLDWDVAVRARVVRTERLAALLLRAYVVVTRNGQGTHRDMSHAGWAWEGAAEIQIVAAALVVCGRRRGEGARVGNRKLPSRAVRRLHFEVDGDVAGLERLAKYKDKISKARSIHIIPPSPMIPRLFTHR